MYMTKQSCLPQLAHTAWLRAAAHGTPLRAEHAGLWWTRGRNYPSLCIAPGGQVLQSN